MKKEITVVLPKGYMNVAVTIDNCLVADTNNSIEWDTLNFPLPFGEWKIRAITGKYVYLINTRRTFWTKWF